MRFRGRHSFIPCLAHVINIICKDMLAFLKVGSAREAGMSETMWKTSKVQPSQEILISYIDRYMDSVPVGYSHHLIGDGDQEWVLKWRKANAFDYPLMAQAARDYLCVPSAEGGVDGKTVQ